jgi:hypothetical protein
VIAGARDGYQAADLDNLVEPTLSALVNGRGWFGARRPNLQWVAVSKRHDLDTGCRLNALAAPPPDWAGTDAEPFLSRTYAGPLPRSIRDDDYVRWVRGTAQHSTPISAAAVSLRFGGLKVNLGDIATGPVKRLIDGLWPVLGGEPPRPHDYKVAALLLEKDVAGVAPGAVEVSVRRLQ